MRVAGIEYPYVSSDRHGLRCSRDKYVVVSQNNRSDIACEIRKTAKLLNDQIEAAKKLGLEVSIKQTPECEVSTAKYRVEITQTIKF